MYTIYLTTFCNFKCTYCCNNVEEPMEITADTLYQVIDFIFQYDLNREIQIHFSGGETLLKKELMCMAMDYIASCFPERKVSYHITTNGLLLDDDLIECLKQFDTFLEIHFDGLEESYQLNRECISNSLGYSQILLNVLKVRDSGIPYSVHVTFTESTLSKLYETVEFLHEKQIDSISLVPAINFFLTKEEVIELERQVGLISDYYMEELSAGRKFDLEQLDGKWERFLGDNTNCFGRCQAGLTTFTILPNGDIYPCGYLTFDQKYKIGDIYQSINIERAKALLTVFYNKDSLRCKDCEINKFCKGTRCGYGNYIKTGSINVPSNMTCRYERIFYAHALRILNYITCDHKLLQGNKLPLCFYTYN